MTKSGLLQKGDLTYISNNNSVWIYFGQYKYKYWSKGFYLSLYENTRVAFSFPRHFKPRSNYLKEHGQRILSSGEIYLGNIYKMENKETIINILNSKDIDSWNFLIDSLKSKLNENII